MISFSGMQIFVSAEAVTVRKVRRIRFEDFIWRGRRDWRSRIVTVTVREPAAFRMGDQMIVHPEVFEKLKQAAAANADAQPAQNLKPAGRCVPINEGDYLWAANRYSGGMRLPWLKTIA